MKPLLHVICDYAPGDLAFSEICSALGQCLPPEFRWQLTSIPSFETVATGFVVAQLGLQNEKLRPKKMVIYANCAPRKDRSAARKNNEGEGLLYGVLDNGVQVVAVNSGYSLSFVRDNLRELWSVKVKKGGSQFRSRDIFPPIVGSTAAGNLDFLKKRLDPRAVIPAIPNGMVAYVDSFGNLKTSYRDGDRRLKGLQAGQRIYARINGLRFAATVATGSFNVKEGDIAFAPGSSGHNRRYWEIFQRGGSAWDTFRRPASGATIQLEFS
ncbi:MAG: SAM-dependent chlorinase/fluorinase [Oligoflexia bacterium]|nr:SAM-dependent chlorinase/fluorinase [Oligoflexia bacterium]